jgi:hypothetical protein
MLSPTGCAIEQYDPSATSEAGVTLRDARSNGIVTPNESVAVAGWFDSTVSQPTR